MSDFRFQPWPETIAITAFLAFCSWLRPCWKGGADMEKEYIAGEPQRYEIDGRVFIVEPQYRKDGESMADILLKLMYADLDEKMRAANKTTTD